MASKGSASAGNMASSLSRSELHGLLTVTAACAAIIANTFQGDGAPLSASLALSGVAFTRRTP